MQQLAPVVMHTGSDKTVANGKFTLSLHHEESGIKPLSFAMLGPLCIALVLCFKQNFNALIDHVFLAVITEPIKLFTSLGFHNFKSLGIN